MDLLDVLFRSKLTPEALPECIRELCDIHGVRVLRMQGNVGKEVADQFAVVQNAAATNGEVFKRSLLIDFAGTSGWDTATIAYIVSATRNRMAAGATVGIINASETFLAVVDIAKLGKLLHIFGSEEEALAALCEPAASAKKL